MYTIYNICAFAQNTVWNRSHDMVLNSDDKLVDASRHDAQEFSNAEHAISFINQRGQALADGCTAHTKVEFYVQKHEVDEEGEVSSTTIYSKTFEVQE